MARKKRTALDKEISRVQKNTRNKLYRLRARGATNTAEISPIQSTEGMTGSQKKAYLRRLQKFNARDNSFVVQENNIAIPREVMQEFRQAEAKANAARLDFRNQVIQAREKGAKKFIDRLGKAADEERRRLQSASRRGEAYHPKKENLELLRRVGAVPKAYADRDITLDVMRLALEATDRVMKIERQGKFADIMPFIMKEDFSSVAAARREIQSLKQTKADIESRRARYDSYKMGIISKMESNGYGGLVSQIRSLSPSQMDWLHYFTEFDELASAFKYPRQIQAGVQETEHEILDYNYDEMEKLVAIATTVRRVKINVKNQ